MFFASSTLLRVYKEGLFLVVQWLRICLAMQRTWVQSFVRELRSHMPWNNQTYVLQLKSPRITTRESTVVVVDQSLSHVRLFVTPWTAAHQVSLSFTISWSLLKLMSIESVMPSNHLTQPSPPVLSLSQHQGLFQ